MINITIITIALLISTPVWSWEWNNKAFVESIQKYKKTLKDWADNPYEIGESIKERYEPSYTELGKNLKKKTSELESSEAYLIFRNAGDTLGKYGGVSDQQQFFRYLSKDTKDGFMWIYYNHEKLPIIGPFKRQVQSRYDYLYFQTIFFTPIIERQYYNFIPR